MGTSVVIPWPTYPTMTKGGKVSKSKMAGRRAPWLSMNVVNNLPRPVHQQVRAMWRMAACHAAWHDIDVDADMLMPARLTVILFKATSHVMDFGAVVEGCKPIIDGLVEAGVFPDDRPECVRGIDVLPCVPVGLKGNTRVEVSWRLAA